MRRWIAWIVSAAVALSCCGCGGVSLSPDERSEALENLQELDSCYMGMVLKSLDGQFYPLIKAGAEAEANRLGVELIVVAPDEEDNAQEQAELVEIMASMALDVLAVAPCDEETLADGLQTAADNGKHILAVDEPMDFAGCEGYIGSDNEQGGQQQGRFAAGLANHPSAVILRGMTESGNHQSRTDGLKQAFAESGISPVMTYNCVSSRSMAHDHVQELLEQNIEMGVICATNDDMAIGAARAVREQQKEIPVVAFDGTPETLQMVQNGELAGVVFQDAYAIGAQCVKAAVKLCDGKQVGDIVLPTQLVTQDNAEYYMEEIQKRLKDN